jgi:alanine-glyoxylate transaminase/serine-glyoxylate transaminase/serine-pyruvate transaminase
MSFQNPVFIPGPTNMPEACAGPATCPRSITGRPPSRTSCSPRATVCGRSCVRRRPRCSSSRRPAPAAGKWRSPTRCRRRHGARGAQRHVLPPLDRHVPAPWPQGRGRGNALGRRHPAASFEEILSADKDGRIKAVLATHNETATGVLSDIAAVRGAIERRAAPRASLFVDGVSSIASMPFEFDAWGVDVAVTGSQKGFMLPAGLAITGFSKKALAAVETGGLPRCFYDIRDMAKSYAAGGYPYTPAVGLLNGLKMSCHMILEPKGSTPSSRATPASPTACAPRWRPGGWNSAPCGPELTPTPSARSARPRGSMPPASSPMPPIPMASPSASALARSPARCSVSGIWGC